MNRSDQTRVFMPGQLASGIFRMQVGAVGEVTVLFGTEVGSKALLSISSINQPLSSFRSL